MASLLWRGFLPIEPRPGNMSPSKTTTYRDYRGVLQSYLPNLPALKNELEGRFAISLHFYMNGVKNKLHPKTDLDNLIKGTIDNLMGFFWIDDSQIDEIKAKITRQAIKSGIDVKVYLLRK